MTRLGIDVLLEGADVYIDNTYVGKTDMYGRLRIHGVREGTHTIRVEKMGYNSVEVVINVPEQLSVIVEMEGI